jgi:hypothetical protein
MPEKYPATWRYSSPETIGQYDDNLETLKFVPGTERANVCHDEYNDNNPVVDCPYWENRTERIRKVKTSAKGGK